MKVMEVVIFQVDIVEEDFQETVLRVGVRVGVGVGVGSRIGRVVLLGIDDLEEVLTGDSTVVWVMGATI
jgi:hypothetical protein